MANKIALVTGASGGIGAACARALCQKGYTVLAHGNRSADALHALVNQLKSEGYDAHAVTCDLSSADACRAMCAEILSLYHRVDALALCAGVSLIVYAAGCFALRVQPLMGLLRSLRRR